MVQSVVLLKRQALLTEHLVKRGSSVLQDFQNAIAANVQTIEHVLDVMNYAFALVDSLVKYQKIARSVPRLNQKSQECRALIFSIGELTEIRNQHQHINRSVLNNFTGPLLGAVSWVSDNVTYTASFNDIGRDRSVPGIIFDTVENRYLHKFCYIFGEKYHDLEKAINGLRNFEAYIAKTFSVSIGEVPFRADQHYLAYSAKISLL